MNENTIIDFAEVKNATSKNTSITLDAIGFSEVIETTQNYTILKVKNYSNVGYVFGLAQFGVTPITIGETGQETLHSILYEEKIKIVMLDTELILSQANINLSNNASGGINFVATNNNASFEHLLLKEPEPQTKHFLLNIDYETSSNEKYELVFVSNTHQVEKTELSSLNVVLLSGIPVTDFRLLLNRKSGTTFNTHTLKSITFKKLKEPVLETNLNENWFLNYGQSSGTFVDGWTAQTNQVLTTKLLCVSLNERFINRVYIDLSATDTNAVIGHNIDLQFSEDGITWENIIVNEPLTKIPVERTNIGFPFVFPFTFINTTNKLYLRFIAKENIFINTTKGMVKIFFE